MSSTPECRQCGKAYPDMSSLTRHLQRCRSTSESSKDALRASGSRSSAATTVTRTSRLKNVASRDNIAALKDRFKSTASKARQSLKRGRRTLIGAPVQVVTIPALAQGRAHPRAPLTGLPDITNNEHLHRYGPIRTLIMINCKTVSILLK
ncbi:hypothetical protein BD626DRAFT_576953 [Schizophyllum amplum]|uniref:C2H2-type domain-containing protein n=1 Tax=Schizophyllum amplum TaxID=97359 RepID=A0A550BSV6_9AGAR|nr:hypothetical protein BD626DRAFT_576953 [Auriculariopsis ampla]